MSTPHQRRRIGDFIVEVKKKSEFEQMPLPAKPCTWIHGPRNPRGPSIIVCPRNEAETLKRMIATGEIDHRTDLSRLNLKD